MKNKNGAKWIWYPGDRELSITNRMLLRRETRGYIEPPFWRIENVYPNVFFYKEVSLKKAETLRLISSGECVVMINEITYIRPDNRGRYLLPPGDYTLHISATRLDGKLPAIFAESESVHSDEDWKCSLDKHRGDKVYVGFSDSLTEADDPCLLDFSFEELSAEKIERDGTVLYDFGKEIFGYLLLKGVCQSGSVTVYYGESAEEALSKDQCETMETFFVGRDSGDYRHGKSRGFRYVQLTGDAGYGGVGALYEYLPLENKGKFTCSNPLACKIHDVSSYTFHLNCREAFIDGLKRDRWYWGGDAYQSQLFNYYSFYDVEINRRTIWSLRGHEPVTHYINHIMDYTYLWFISVYEHALYMGDKAFVRSLYGRAKTLMSFCLSRVGADGFVSGRPYYDWVFLDWAYMPGEGALCAEQILLSQSLVSMAKLADWLGFPSDAATYAEKAAALNKRIFDVFYDPERCIFYHNAVDGKHTESLTRYANIFALMYGLIDKKDEDKLIRNGLLSPEIQRVETPYAKFYELVSLCKAGLQDKVCDLIDDYWGGMLREGATTFWELYNPDDKGAEHLSMYGKPFAKSLCHAWGASPLYIYGRFFLGVCPEEFGYARYAVSPEPGRYDFVEGVVPVGDKKISVYMDDEILKVFSDAPGEGVIRLKKNRVGAHAYAQRDNGDETEIPIIPGVEMKISLCNQAKYENINKERQGNDKRGN